MSKYGFGPHTLSVPRLQPADASVLDNSKYRVSDEDYKKIVAIYRLALPHVGVVVSTREPAALRDELLSIGASQISAGSKTSPSGYLNDDDTEQFEVGDTRSLDDVIGKIADMGLMPSLCTACYREGRSGEEFKHLATSEMIKTFCHENAILSLKEYAENSASDEVKQKLIKILDKEISKCSNGLAGKLKQIEEGKSDIHV